MSSFDDKDENAPFLVLINVEEQYSLWPKGINVPNGWKVVFDGTRAEAGKYVNEHWTDMRPLSLRKHMEEFEKKKRQEQQPPPEQQQPPEQQSQPPG